MPMITSDVKVVLGKEKLLLVEFPEGKILVEITLDELAEIMEFRYAIPWNRSKDTLEKLFLIIEDILNAYSGLYEKSLTKEDLMRAVKLRRS